MCVFGQTWLWFASQNWLSQQQSQYTRYVYSHWNTTFQSQANTCGWRVANGSWGAFGVAVSPHQTSTMLFLSAVHPSRDGCSPENKVWWSVRELASTSTRSRGLVGWSLARIWHLIYQWVSEWVSEWEWQALPQSYRHLHRRSRFKHLN